MLTGSFLGGAVSSFFGGAVDEVAFDVENQEKAHAAELGSDCAVSHPVIHPFPFRSDKFSEMSLFARSLFH